MNFGIQWSFYKLRRFLLPQDVVSEIKLFNGVPYYNLIEFFIWKVKFAVVSKDIEHLFKIILASINTDPNVVFMFKTNKLADFKRTNITR